MEVADLVEVEVWLVVEVIVPEDGLPVPTIGGWSTKVASSKCPVPQWITSPFGPVSVSVGGTVFPVASAIVKRVVKYRSEVAGDENR